MQIEFFHDPQNQPRSREEVRMKQIGLFVHDDGPKVTFGVELTPFLERPCIDVDIFNAAGERAASLSVIETMTPNFSLVMHLRDGGQTGPYELTAVVYYTTPETDPQLVDRQTIRFDAAEPGEHIFPFQPGI
jgi:hypothetical protein